MSKVYIYKLISPISKRVRYIGKTINPKERYSKHLSSKGNTMKHKWVSGLKAKGMKPLIEIVEVCNQENVDEREIYWISIFKHHWGFDLCNHTSGGEGGDTFSGRKHKQSSKDLISKANKGKKRKDLADQNRLTKSKRIHQLSYETNDIINTFSSVREASEKTGCSLTNIGKMANGTLIKSQKTVGGYKWEYAY